MTVMAKSITAAIVLLCFSIQMHHAAIFTINRTIEGAVHKNDELFTLPTDAGTVGTAEYEEINQTLCLKSRKAVVNFKPVYDSWYNCRLTSVEGVTAGIIIELDADRLTEQRVDYATPTFLDSIRNELNRHRYITADKETVYFGKVFLDLDSNINFKALVYRINGTAYKNGELTTLPADAGRKGTANYEKLSTHLCQKTFKAVSTVKGMQSNWENCEVLGAGSTFAIIGVVLNADNLEAQKVDYDTLRYRDSIIYALHQFLYTAVDKETPYFGQVIILTSSISNPRYAQSFCSIEGTVYKADEPITGLPDADTPGTSDYTNLNRTLCEKSKKATEGDKEIFAAWRTCRLTQTNRSVALINVTLDASYLQNFRPTEAKYRICDLITGALDVFKYTDADKTSEYFGRVITYWDKSAGYDLTKIRTEGIVYKNGRPFNSASGTVQTSRLNHSLCTNTRQALYNNKMLYRSWYSCELKEADEDEAEILMALNSNYLTEQKVDSRSSAFRDLLKNELNAHTYSPTEQQNEYFGRVTEVEDEASMKSPAYMMMTSVLILFALLR